MLSLSGLNDSDTAVDRSIINAAVHPAIAFHDRLAPVWAAKYASKSFRHRGESLLALVDDRHLKGQNWLDAGCGTGNLACLMATRGCVVSGVDASPEMIRAAEVVAARQCAACQPPCFRVIPTIERLDWPDGSFDGILCSSVLEYLEDPGKSVCEMARVLKPGGLLIVSVPNRLSLYRRILKTCFRATGGRWPQYFAFSRHEYSRKEFFQLLSHYGLKPRAGRYFGPRLPKLLARTSILGTLLLVSAAK